MKNKEDFILKLINKRAAKIQRSIEKYEECILILKDQLKELKKPFLQQAKEYNERIKLILGDSNEN